MNKDFLEQITELLMPERVIEALQKDAQYQAVVTEERRLFEMLESSLNEEQKEALTAYYNAASDTFSCMESFAYKQGMKDLLSLFRSLSVDSASESIK